MTKKEIKDGLVFRKCRVTNRIEEAKVKNSIPREETLLKLAMVAFRCAYDSKVKNSKETMLN